jgi:hypothetical protein
MHGDDCQGAETHSGQSSGTAVSPCVEGGEDSSGTVCEDGCAAFASAAAMTTSCPSILSDTCCPENLLLISERMSLSRQHARKAPVARARSAAWHSTSMFCMHNSATAPLGTSSSPPTCTTAHLLRLVSGSATYIAGGLAKAGNSSTCFTQRAGMTRDLYTRREGYKERRGVEKVGKVTIESTDLLRNDNGRLL